jgi:hypothetical protein
MDGHPMSEVTAVVAESTSVYAHVLAHFFRSDVVERNELATVAILAGSRANDFLGNFRIDTSSFPGDGLFLLLIDRNCRTVGARCVIGRRRPDE